MRFGPYTVEDEPSKVGGQAFVYFGIESTTGARVAVKMARPSAWAHRRMKREIEVQRKLNHPNILPILWHDGDREWYAAPEASGSLEDHGQYSKRDWIALRVGLLGVALAVEYAHGHGFIHRDLSPGNVLIFPDRWVVADWGFVLERPKVGPRLTQPLERFGTPDFMAPEMVGDPMKVTSAADVFSLGRLAVWGTGLEPREAGSGDDALVRWWRRFIDGTTAYDPQGRWTMQDVVTHLRAKPALVASDIEEEPSPGLRAEPCPNCGSTRGHDGAGRCVRCHALDPY